MGAPMALNIHRAGFDLAVFNRNPERSRPFAEQGIKVPESAAELAASSQVLVLMVTGPSDLQEVLFGPQGMASALKPGSVVINMSTVSPEATEAAAQGLKKLDVHLVDAPVSGTVGPAQAGKLVVLAGADENDLERVRPVLDAMSSRIVHCGPVGAGTKMKLAVNLLLGGVMQTLAESLVYAQSAGIDPRLLLDSISEGALSAPMFQLKGQAILERRFEKAFPIDLVAKDLDLVLQAAEQSGAELPQTRLNLQRYHKCQGLGLGDEDMSALVKVLEQTARIKVGD